MKCRACGADIHPTEIYSDFYYCNACGRNLILPQKSVKAFTEKENLDKDAGSV
jgi:predicted RNA-binding Zn-ribbon protein involved in translation (DUF1610 family)